MLRTLILIMMLSTCPLFSAETASAQVINLSQGGVFKKAGAYFIYIRQNKSSHQSYYIRRDSIILVYDNSMKVASGSITIRAHGNITIVLHKKHYNIAEVLKVIDGA